MSEYYYVGLVLRNLELEEDIAQCWADCGSFASTTLEGEGQLSEDANRFKHEDAPMFPSFSNLFRGGDPDRKFLFAIVKGQEGLQRIIENTQKVTGDLKQTGNGVLFALPLTTVIGL